MMIEDKQEDAVKEEDLFEDLPDGDDEKNKDNDDNDDNDDEDNGGGDKDKADEKREDDNDEGDGEGEKKGKDKADDTSLAIIKSKDKAIREERKRRKDAETELNELKAKNTEIDKEEIVRKVKDDIILDNYTDAVKKKIKDIPGVTKSTARKIYETVESLPRNTDPEVSVDLAISFIKEQKRLEGGYQPDFVPNSQGVFLNDDQEKKPEKVSASQKDLGKQHGKLEDEDFEKYNKLPIL